LTGVDAEIRYADSGEMAAAILEEGDASPASLFISQDAGLLGVLAGEGRLAPLPDELLERVDPRFRSPDGLWVGVSGRARVAVYNTDALTEADLPASVLDLTDPRWRGQIGWAPGNASFQAFVTALRQLEGEEGARAWLEGMIANEPQAFDGNAPIVRAVGEGELQLGLVNHYYLYEIKAEEGEDFPIANHFFSGGDPGSLVNVAGLGVLSSAPDPEQALALADCLLQPEAQTYFATETSEYPLIEGVESAEGLPALADVESPEIDLTDLADLEGTQELLTDLGLL
jgi:iron(III) transport system substrate-binding protein